MTRPLWLGLNAPAELFGLDGALGLRSRVKGEIFSGVRREKLFVNFFDFFFVLGRAHPKDTTVELLPENI